MERPASWAAASSICRVLLVPGLSLALRSHRYWPIWAAGFQLLAILTYWAHSLDRTLGGWVYLTAGILWGYLLVGALAYGTWNVWRERAYPAIAEDAITDPGATRR